MRVTETDGILFCEKVPHHCETIREISCELDEPFGEGSQLKSLVDLKRQMAREAKRLGGNAIVGFEYGQRSVGFWRSLFSLDDVIWYGRGRVAQMDDPRRHVGR